MRTRTLGTTGRTVSVIGFGAMPLSMTPSLSEEEALRICRQTLDWGVTLFDTADTYGQGSNHLHQNERLLARAFADRRSEVVIATKGGCVRTPNGWTIDGHPDRLYQAVCQSYEALGGREPIPLWQHHWPDPRYSIREMLLPIRRAQEEGLISHVGVGNYSCDQLQQACDVLPIATVQNQFNPWHREAETDGVLDYCEQHNLVFFPWRPLGGAGLSERLAEISVIQRIAQAHGVSPQRVVLSWLLQRSPCILPIPGSTRLDHIHDCLLASELQLDQSEMSLINTLDPALLPTRERASSWTTRPPLSSETPR